MITFLEETLLNLKKKHHSISGLTLIVPSRRAGGFLKNYLKKNATSTLFAPKILSIETFIETVSGLKIIDATQLLFKSYSIYLSLGAIEEKESFDSYCTWAPTLLGDFNEIDRYLLDTQPFFNYLKDIQDINHWYVKNEHTPLIKKYLSFWESLNEFYDKLQAMLLKDKLGYQGLTYRKAAEKINNYLQANNDKKHVFIGFNALNDAEQLIFQEMLKTGSNEVYWDTDARFMEDTAHSASLFLRKYKNQWPYYKKNEFPGIFNYYNTSKIFHFVEVQKNIGQAKYVGQLLSTYTQEELNNTAIVLADEKLLNPLLHSLPNNVQQVNITMGIPLKNFPVAVFFEILLSIKVQAGTTYYYKDIISLLNHPFAAAIFPEGATIIAQIVKQNKTHIAVETLQSFEAFKVSEFASLLFSDWKKSSHTALKKCSLLLQIARNAFEPMSVEAMVLYQLHTLFNSITTLNNDFTYVNTIQTVQTLYTELISSTTLDYRGDAYNGLQIMGVLESRVLDFKNVIITSVNEGVLPSGKSNASFITYDLKQQYNLPKFTEKDAIYTYHFTHLLHRAQSATFLYNTHSEGMNSGEKSRVLLQLEVENNPHHTIIKKVLSPKVTFDVPVLKQIQKTESVMQRLQEIANNGFSPSSLTNYICNPIDFYYQKVLGIREIDMIEETVAANTLGTVVHETLENLYTPFVGTVLNATTLKNVLPQVGNEVSRQFSKHFEGGDITKGKNLLIYEVAKKYVSNFINFEIKDLEAGNEIHLIALEASLKTPITIPNITYPVAIKGLVDRVDMYNGMLRIIDYKTGKVEQKDLDITNWEELTKEYKYSKAFQVLTYATMYQQHHNNAHKMEAGIISFKNLNNGFLKFGTKQERSRSKNQIIDQETIALFIKHASTLIAEILNPDIPFTEKEIV